MLGVSRVRQALSKFAERRAEHGHEHAANIARAAVAAVVREGDSELEILFIRRAEDPRDPWSGHIAFPGGKAQPSDKDLIETALRETREELGLDLSRANLLGPLPPLRAIARGRRVPLVVSPFVFVLDPPQPLAPNREVAEVLWAPLAPMLRQERAVKYAYEHEGSHYELPGHQVGERVVWGMTYRMLDTLFEALRATETA